MTDKLKRFASALFLFVQMSLRIRDRVFAVVIVFAVMAIMCGGFWAHALVVCLMLGYAAKLAFRL